MEALLPPFWLPLLDQTDNRLAYTTLQWNGRSSADENLPAGAYIISLVEDGKEVEILRVVKSEQLANTRNSEPATLNPQPETRNSELGTRNSEL